MQRGNSETVILKPLKHKPLSIASCPTSAKWQTLKLKKGVEHFVPFSGWANQKKN